MSNASTSEHVPPSSYDAVAAAVIAGPMLAARASEVDAAARYPHEDIATLAEVGLLKACLPETSGGIGLAVLPTAVHQLRQVLTLIGRSSLTVGRLYEGHVNAVRLVALYNPAAMFFLAAEAAAGRPSGVWNAADRTGLKAVRIEGGWSLSGTKIFCSGSGSIRLPLVTASIGEEGRPLMMLPEVTPDRVDLSQWRATGMRGTATGIVDFTGLVVTDAMVVGSPGDYYRSPFFSGGAWRVLAVQLGGLGQLMDLHAARLNMRASTEPLVRARFATAAGAHEAAKLIVCAAAARAESGGDGAAIDAYVDLARGSFEQLTLACIAAARSNIGLASFIAPDPFDRVIRDLETYLRQPSLDPSRDNAAAWLLANNGSFK